MLRELFRRHPSKLAGIDLVVALREPAGGLALEALASEVRGLLDLAVGRQDR